MPLPGHLWNLRDEYGTYWNFEPEATFLHLWYFRRKLASDFPQFTFTLVMTQCDPTRPVPMPYICSEEEERGQEEKATRHPTAVRNPAAYAGEDF